MMLFIFSSIYGNDPTPFFDGRGSVDVSVPRCTAMIIASVGMLSVAINMAVYREKGVLRRYRATPLRPQTILAATVLVNLAMILLGTLLLIIAAKVIYDLRFDGNPLAVLVGFVLASLSFFSLVHVSVNSLRVFSLAFQRCRTIESVLLSCCHEQ